MTPLHEHSRRIVPRQESDDLLEAKASWHRREVQAKRSRWRPRYRVRLVQVIIVEIGVREVVRAKFFHAVYQPPAEFVREAQACARDRTFVEAGIDQRRISGTVWDSPEC